MTSTSNSNNPLREHELCFIDVETTGARFGFHEIVDVAIVRTDSDANQVLGEWSQRLQLLHPERSSDVALQITGYAPDSTDWRDAPHESVEIWEAFATFCHGAIGVCHNPSFDRAFISFAASSQGVFDLGLDYHWIGTQSLAWSFYRTGRLSGIRLIEIAESLGLEHEHARHTAAGVAACLRAYRGLMKLDIKSR